MTLDDAPRRIKNRGRRRSSASRLSPAARVDRGDLSPGNQLQEEVLQAVSWEAQVVWTQASVQAGGLKRASRQGPSEPTYLDELTTIPS